MFSTADLCNTLTFLPFLPSVLNFYIFFSNVFLCSTTDGLLKEVPTIAIVVALFVLHRSCQKVNWSSFDGSQQSSNAFKLTRFRIFQLFIHSGVGQGNRILRQLIIKGKHKSGGGGGRKRRWNCSKEVNEIVSFKHTQFCALLSYLRSHVRLQLRNCLWVPLCKDIWSNLSFVSLSICYREECFLHESSGNVGNSWGWLFE